MAAGIQSLAMNLDKIVPVIVTLATLIGGRFAWSLTASSSAMAANSIAATTAAVRLAAFQTAMTASMTGATRATVVATAAMRGFTAAIAANPIGLAVIAITALTAAFASYKATVEDAAEASEKSNKLIREFGSHSNGSVAGVNALTGATSALAVETLKLADARMQDMRAARLQQIESNRAAAQKLREPNLWQRGLELGLHAVPGVGGTAARTVARARESAAAALDKQNTELMAQAIQIGMAPGAVWTHDGAQTRSSFASDGPKKKSGSGPSPEELVAAREMLRLQGQLQLLQAQGNEDQARSVQRQIDLINITKQFKDAQVQNAEAEAKAQMDALWAAEDAVRIAEEAERQGKKNAERRERANQAEQDHARRQNDLLLDRLGYEAELARLTGDRSRIEVAERELFIAERINELLALKPGLISEAEARAQATSEYGALESADREGQARDEFRRAFADGIRAAIDGDMGGFAAESVLRAALADAFQTVGLLFPVNATEAITGYLTKSEEWADQYRDWSTGTATGGPNGDGLYPITDREGLVRWLASPAKVAAEVFDAVQANAAAIQALAESAVTQTGLASALTDYASKSGAHLTDATATAPDLGADGTEVTTASWVNLAIGKALAPFVAQMQNLTDAIGGVASNVGSKAPAGSTAARLEALEAAVLALAPKADPILTGAARVSKPPPGANNTRIPTTAWVRELLAAGGLGGGFSLPNAAVVTDAAYGARGDASTDDTNAFKAALASGKPVIIIPPGTYMISDTLQVPSNRTIVGYGVVSRLLLVPGVTNNTNILAATGRQKINILDLVLDGNRLNQPSGNHTTCLQFSGVDDVNLNNVHGVGSLIDGLYLHNCKRLAVTDCRGYDNGYPGVDASGMNIDTCDGASINGFQGYNNGFHGLYVSAATNSSFANIMVHDNSHDGIRAVWAAANCSFSNVQSYRNGWRGMMFSDGCYGISINNAQLTDNRRHGLGGSEIWSLQIANSFINGNDWSGIATSGEGDDISAVNVSLGGNGGGQIEQAAGSSIRIFNPA